MDLGWLVVKEYQCFEATIIRQQTLDLTTYERSSCTMKERHKTQRVEHVLQLSHPARGGIREIFFPPFFEIFVDFFGFRFF